MNCIPLLVGWLTDLALGDPQRLPHPVVWFGRAIGYCEQRLNKGYNRKRKGALCAIGLIVSVFAVVKCALCIIPSVPLRLAIESLLVFYCLAGTTLIREVRQVFVALEKSLEDGRRQVARIVGRDTSNLSAQEIRTAALETLAENLSDGVIAPLFWYALLGVPGMVAYKMVNTLDSMIGYRNDRYKDFGYMAAKIDDVANYLPARITSLLMIIVSGKSGLFRFVAQYGPQHLSPNSGYPEAALAGILDCRFGGPHDYFGKEVVKPFIGQNPREISSVDLKTAISINRRVEILAVMLVLISKLSC